MRAARSTEGPAPDLGNVVIASQVVTAGPGPRHTRNIILLLAACVALMMTGSGIIMPVFARRFSELGSGVEALGLMTMSFALAQFVAAPFMGSLADRIGRRPVVLVALAAFAASNVGFLLASSTQVSILVRALAGTLTAGLFPAAMSIVADIVPQDRRARWIGIVMGSYGVGLILGPVLGGVLYDRWGFAAPFVASAAIASIACVAAVVVVPETHTRQVRLREELRQRRMIIAQPQQRESFWSALPRPLYVLGTLLFLDFTGVFAFAFIEPQLIFYCYEELGWTTVQFGVVVAVYGLLMVLGQIVMGRLSDRFGRKPAIIVGTLLAVTFYAGIAVTTSFSMVLFVAAVAGLGEALKSPALSAFYFHITAKQHRSRIAGIKGSASSLGGVAGPLLVAFTSTVATSQTIFAIGGGLLLVGAILAAVALKEPRHVAVETRDAVWEVSDRRYMAAQAALRGIALSATIERKVRGVA